VVVPRSAFLFLLESHLPAFLFPASADVYNVSAFQLPDPAGRAGGACTSALLQVLYKDHQQQTEPLTWVEVLRRMRTVLRGMGYDQIPQLTSSRLIDVNKTMYIVPPGSTGVKRAITIGINYTGQQGQLSGCHNDVANISDYLEKVHGFSRSNMLQLLDDGAHVSRFNKLRFKMPMHLKSTLIKEPPYTPQHAPTKQNILNAFERITQYSQPGDVVFLHYSGHGSRVPDQDGDEEDGYGKSKQAFSGHRLSLAWTLTMPLLADETLVPVDFQRAGQIRDDDILKTLVKPLKAGVTMTCLMDCCHSGTVLDLPYRFTADGDVMVRNDKFSFLSTPEGAVAAACCLFLLLDCLLGGEF
jgi:hypothetical protein